MKNLTEEISPRYRLHTLSNGLRIIHEPSLSKVAYCGFAVDAGTRDELENEQGMAHFVEHLILRVPKTQGVAYSEPHGECRWRFERLHQ